jgi:hypothetical protein
VNMDGRDCVSARRRHDSQRVEQHHGIAAAGKRDGNPGACGDLCLEGMPHGGMDHRSRVVGFAPHRRRRSLRWAVDFRAAPSPRRFP